MSFLKLFALTYSLQFGYSPVDIVLVNDSIYRRSYSEIYTDIGAGIKIGKYFDVGGTGRINAAPLSLISYVPTQGYYEFHVKFSSTHFEAGYMHYCSHPIHSIVDDNAQKIQFESIETGGDQFFVKVKGEIKLF